MDSADFQKAWLQMQRERFALLDERTTLENRLTEVRKKISHITEAMNHIAPLAGTLLADEDDISRLGLTDVVRFVLKRSSDRMSAQDVRHQLIEKGYDLSDLTAPMASIYKILSRLVDDSQEVEREKEGGRVYYRWKIPTITDEDIPF